MFAYAIVQPANGAVGFDTDAVISRDLADKFHAVGYQYVLRYLSLGADIMEGDLTAAEAQDIVGAGLALGPVQHVRYVGWRPTGAMGAQDGNNAANHAVTIGIPPGVTVWLDLEGISDQAAPGAVSDYCRSWYQAVAGAGYMPGLYVGDHAILDSSQLYDLPFTRYWHSASDVPDVPTRGYCMTQTLYEYPVYGITIDRDTVNTDNLGGRPAMMAAQDDNSNNTELSTIHDTITSITSQLRMSSAQLGAANDKLSALIGKG